MFHAVALEKVAQGTPEWKAARKQGIGGSDAAAAIGVDQYRSPHALWLEKTGQSENFEGNWYTDRGLALEPVIRKHYSEKFGREVRVPEHILQHPEHKFMLCSLDGFSDDGRIAEFKTATHYRGWGVDGTDQIPHNYLVQVQHNLAVTGAQFADVGVSIAGNIPRYFVVEADKELQGMIIHAEQLFWEKVLSRVEPEQMSIEEMRQRYNIKEGTYAVANPMLLECVEKLRQIKSHLKEVEGNEEELKENIQRFLLQQGASTLIDETGVPLCTWNESTRNSVDSKKLKAEKPDVYAAYTKSSVTRTFLLK